VMPSTAEIQDEYAFETIWFGARGDRGQRLF